MHIYVYVITDHRHAIVVPQVFLTDNDALIYLQIARTNIDARENQWKISKIDIYEIYEAFRT